MVHHSGCQEVARCCFHFRCRTSTFPTGRILPCVSQRRLSRLNTYFQLFAILHNENFLAAKNPHEYCMLRGSYHTTQPSLVRGMTALIQTGRTQSNHFVYGLLRAGRGRYFDEEVRSVATQQTIVKEEIQPLKANGHVRWTVCTLLFAATSINYMDRQVLGILAPLLQVKIGWTETQYGLIIGAFTFAYAAGLLLAGWMVDKLGTRIGYAIIMGIWSLAAMSHTLARSAFGFGIARFFLGLGESGNFPAAIKTTAEWFPKKERSLATGIFNSGANVGAIIAPALIPWITMKFSWRAGFLVTGIFSSSWILWWLLRYRKPEDHPKLSAQEDAYIHSDPVESTATISWWTILGYKQTWAFAIGKFLTDPVWWLYLYWLPKFFSNNFHLKLTGLALPLIVVYNVAAVGSIGGGYLPAFFSRRGFSMATSRKLAMLLCAIGVTPVYFTIHGNSLWGVIGLLSLATAAHQGWSANLFTTASDMFPRCAVGAVVGIGGWAGAIGGVLFAYVTGKVLDITGSYAIPFTFAALAYLVGLGIMHLLAPNLEKVDVEPSPSC